MDKKIEKMMSESRPSRRFVKLAPGEPQPTYADVQPPEGFRLETDEEFCARLLG